MFQLIVKDTFRIKNRGVVATGRIASGAISVGDTVLVNDRTLVVKGIEMIRKVIDSASEGDNVGLLFDDTAYEVLTRGAVITGHGVAPTTSAAPSPTVDDVQRQIGLGERPRKWGLFSRG